VIPGSLRALWPLAREAVEGFFEASPFQLAGALSFFTLLSLSPLVLVVVGVAGLVLSEDVVRAQLLVEVDQLVGPAGGDTVEAILAHAVDPRRNRVSVAIGIITLLVGATTVFGQLQAALNRIWQVKAAPSRGAVWSFVRTRLLSLALVLVLGFLLLVSLGVSAVLTALHEYLSRAMPAGAAVWQGVDFAVSLAVVALLIGTIFKVLPDVRIAWRDVWFGAGVTALLFSVGKALIGFYLGHAGIASSYGAAGSLVVFLVWVYYSSLIILFGAQITHTFARVRGAAIEPAPHAVPLRG
jgi:membrane protein